MRFGTHRRDVEPVRSFHVRSVVKAADESINGNIDGALDVAVAAQRKVRQPAILARGHAKLHRRARSRHRQIERVLKLDLLRLGQSKSAGDVGERLLRKDDCAGTHRPDRADELNVFDGFGKALQAAAILFEETQDAGDRSGCRPANAPDARDQGRARRATYAASRRT